ncbi:hypothetical protein CPB83DRAFT_907948 [Crepidotus variabilis]|uniref:Uncharacterized protein n=1 Tax=Crepidotus variabilis TaxID=179855 RepID=A0A9P6EDK8_9AGAR|nr:hypothetical protein CPB83DRAFT_907948 [Crepidotus variabilis]
MAIELSFGCLPLGLWGLNDPADVLDTGDSIQYFTPDSMYKPTRQSNFTGPDYVFEPLSNAADKLRQHVLPTYNTSHVLSNGNYGSLYVPDTTSFSWVTKVKTWYPSNDHTANSNDTKVQTAILEECSIQVNQALKITVTPETRSYSCSNVLLTGSYIDPKSSQVFRGFSTMACASATSLSMVSATLEADQEGYITSKMTTISSDLHDVTVDFWQVLYNETSNMTLFDSLGTGSIQRFTLSENPSGKSTHYILQSYPFSYSSLMLAYGAGSVGYTIPQIGVAVIDPSTSNSGTTTETIINGTFFSCSNFSTAVVTNWAAGLGASYFLSGYALNGFAALDKKPFTVRSTGGKPAVCYQPAYFAAFAPLLIAALLVIVWTVGMLLTSKLRAAKIWEKRYGGLAPTLTGFSRSEVLAWEKTGEVHYLRPLNESDVSTPGLLSVPYETTPLFPDKENHID